MLHRMLLILGLGFLLACSDKPSPTATDTLVLSRVSGNDQVAAPGTPLDQALVVQVVDQQGQGVIDREVIFWIAAGSGQLSAERVRTDSQGRAATRLTLGEQAQTVRVRAEVAGGQGVVEFRAAVSRTDSGEAVDSSAVFAGTAHLPGGTTMEFTWIDSGSFVMGSHEFEDEREADEGPQHQVHISRGFWFGTHEVTQAQWTAVMTTNPSQFPGSQRPVERVSWDEAQLFIDRLNALIESPLYRLPTEAEWEYAARAGTLTRWSFGDSIDRISSFAWYAGNNDPAGTKTVGGKLPNPWGLFDMHGNVWEWCQDRYDPKYYDEAPRQDPPGPNTGRVHVIRGGAFGSLAPFLRSAYRDWSPADARGEFLGLRLVRLD